MSNRHLFLLSRRLNGRHGPPQAPPKEGMSAAPISAFLYPSPVCFLWDDFAGVGRLYRGYSPRITHYAGRNWGMERLSPHKAKRRGTELACSYPPKLGGWGSERPLLHRFPINLICLLDIGRPRWGRFSEAIPLSPHHPLRGMIRGYREVTAPQSLYIVWIIRG